MLPRTTTPEVGSQLRPNRRAPALRSLPVSRGHDVGTSNRMLAHPEQLAPAIGHVRSDVVDARVGAIALAFAADICALNRPPCRPAAVEPWRTVKHGAGASGRNGQISASAGQVLSVTSSTRPA